MINTDNSHIRRIFYKVVHTAHPHCFNVTHLSTPVVFVWPPTRSVCGGPLSVARVIYALSEKMEITKMEGKITSLLLCFPEVSPLNHC